MVNKNLIEKARRKTKLLQKLRKDPRYLKTVGKLKREGLLDVRDVPEYRGQVFLEEAFWAAELEPSPRRPPSTFRFPSQTCAARPSHEPERFSRWRPDP